MANSAGMVFLVEASQRTLIGGDRILNRCPSHGSQVLQSKTEIHLRLRHLRVQTIDFQGLKGYVERLTRRFQISAIFSGHRHLGRGHACPDSGRKEKRGWRALIDGCLIEGESRFEVISRLRLLLHAEGHFHQHLSLLDRWHIRLIHHLSSGLDLIFGAAQRHHETPPDGVGTDCRCRLYRIESIFAG